MYLNLKIIVGACDLHLIYGQQYPANFATTDKTSFGKSSTTGLSYSSDLFGRIVDIEWLYIFEEKKSVLSFPYKMF